MNNPKKILRIRLLMVISHLLLTLFVLQWLVSRYDQEKTDLKDELDREFISTEQKIIDSLLLVNVVNPFLHEKRKPHYKMIVVTDGGSHNKLDTINAEQVNGIDQAKIKSIHVNKRTSTINIKINGDSTVAKITTNSDPKKSIIVSDSLKSNTFRERFLINSYKVLSSSASGASNGKRSVSLSFSSGVDSSLLLKEILKRPISANFKLSWTNKDSSQLKKSDVFILLNNFPNDIGIDVKDYSFYLLKKISPQIAFGIILILLTGLSFIISFLSLKKQVQLNLLRNEFVGNISHELKTPVATVKVALEALQSYNIKSEPAKADEYIQIAQKEMNRLDLLIQKVLTSSIYEDAKKILQKERLVLNEVVNDVVESMQVRFDQLHAMVSLETGTEEFIIFADRIHVQGVLINLLDNSIKYVSGEPAISIRIYNENENVVVAISDNGIGIPNEYISQVFDKFFRVPTENRHNVKGYGLGLNYCATIMKHHNGSINVVNRKEGGCTFTLIFPKHTV